MIILEIILIIVSIGILIVIGITDDKSNDIILPWFLGIIFFAGVMLIAISLQENNTIKKSLKDNTLEIEIKQKIINGQEISRDTVYIFTPKNK